MELRVQEGHDKWNNGAPKFTSLPRTLRFYKAKGTSQYIFYIICASISKIGHTIIASGHINRTTKMDQKS